MVILFKISNVWCKIGMAGEKPRCQGKKIKYPWQALGENYLGKSQGWVENWGKYTLLSAEGTSRSE